jgi:hypothetical protein
LINSLLGELNRLVTSDREPDIGKSNSNAKRRWKMSAVVNARWKQWLLIGCAVCLLLRLGAAATAKPEQGVARMVWQYREMEAPANAVQAALEELGRDGWEVFNVYGAATVSDQDGVAKLVPHTFYIFAKKPH